MSSQSKVKLFSLFLYRYKLTFLTFTAGIGITSFKAWSNRSVSTSYSSSANYLYWKSESEKVISIESIKQRQQQLIELQSHSSTKNSYDILIIGGGATGSGIALDGITRGLSVGLVECNDFASGTSSRSTKLIHGGVRYLEKAITNFDLQSWNLVKEAILERRHLINLSPHLSWSMPIIIPVYDEYFIRGWYQLIKHYIGLKIYEAMAGKDGLLCPTYYLSSPYTKHIFPHLKQPNMTGSIVYFDGIHNDSRMCLNIAMTASSYGANIANYVEVVDFIKEYTMDDGNNGNADYSKQKIIGVRLRDNLTGKEWNTFSKCIINATGCCVDKLRKLDNNKCKNLIIPSRGTHLILPNTFSSSSYGMLIPQTKDNRVAFLLPFEGVTIAGTTDIAMKHENLPIKNTKNIQLIQPSEYEVNQILNEINNYLDVPVNQSDIDAVWSGIRPLCAIPNGYTQKVINGTVNFIQQNNLDGNGGGDDDNIETKNISRHHLIELSNSGLITICGGKWTTYRQMAQDTLDIICNINPEIGRRSTECVTKIIKLIGSANWTHSVSAILERHQIPNNISNHLSSNYGDKSFIVGNLYLSKWNKLLAGGYNYTEAEVIYCTKYEMSQTPIDILSRRTRLAQLNKAAAEYALPKVIKLMGNVHKWNVRQRVMYFHDTMEFLRTMHVKDRHKWGRSRHTLDYSRRVVETVLNGPSMTDEAIQFVIDRFWDYHSQNIDDDDDDDQSESDDDDESDMKAHKQSRQLFEGCISRSQCLSLAKEFSEIFGDDRVIDALMFTGQQQLGLYEILVSCAACASHRELFESNYYY